MPRDFQHEAIAKFLIPDRPQEDNYPDPDEFEEKEKEWMEQRDRVLACRAVWVEREQLAENRHVQEATHAAGERTRLRCEVAEHKLKAGAQKKVGAVVEVISHGKSVCARCSMKGLSICNLSVGWLMEVPPGIPCIKQGGSSRHQTACMACHDDKAKCEWIVNSNAGSKDASSMSGAVASLSQVPSSPVVASSSWVSCSSPPQPETHASVDALREIAEAICDIQCGQEEHLEQVEGNVQHSLATVEQLVQVLVNGGAPKVAEWALVSSMGGSQCSDRTLLLVDYDQELLVKSEGGGDVEMS